MKPSAPTRQPLAQHNMAVVGPYRLDTQPTTKAPNGVSPVKASVNKLMIRPRLSSGTIVWMIGWHETPPSIIVMPASSISTSDIHNIRDSANNAKLPPVSRQANTIRDVEPRKLGRPAKYSAPMSAPTPDAVNSRP